MLPGHYGAKNSRRPLERTARVCSSETGSRHPSKKRKLCLTTSASQQTVESLLATILQYSRFLDCWISSAPTAAQRTVCRRWRHVEFGNKQVRWSILVDTRAAQELHRQNFFLSPFSFFLSSAHDTCAVPPSSFRFAFHSKIRTSLERERETRTEFNIPSQGRHVY